LSLAGQFENTHDLLGDLFIAKNAGVTLSPLLLLVPLWISGCRCSSPLTRPRSSLLIGCCGSLARCLFLVALTPGCTPSSHWNVYLPSLKVPCVDLDLDLEPGKRLALPRSVMTTAVFANVVFLARGVVVAAPNPFSPQGENPVCSFMERWTMAAFSLFPPWQHRPA
jgi:hypothetical protein